MGGLLVQTLAMGICGTDVEIVSGRYGWPPPGRERLIIGHESLGRVLAAPEGSHFASGDLIVGVVRRPDPVVDASWRMIDEILNAVLFLLLGLEVFAVENWFEVLAPALLAIPICLLARLVSVAVPVSAVRAGGSLRRGLVPVLTWSGLRGGISVAFVLALPRFSGK
jgi:hypothetical protein